MANNGNLMPPFEKNDGEKKDKRINRKGRPKSFDALRKLAQEIAGEAISDTEKLTRIEALLRVMSSSRNPADRKTFLEYAFGKVKDEVAITADVRQEIGIKEIDYRAGITKTEE